MERLELRHQNPLDDQEVMGSAFLDPNSDQMVIVLINPSHQTRQVQIALAGVEKSAFRLKKFTPCITSTIDDLHESGPTDFENGVLLPPDSVVTFVSNPQRQGGF